MSKLPSRVRNRLKKEALVWGTSLSQERPEEVEKLLERAEVFRANRPPLPMREKSIYPKKIISRGQTGIDRAALDLALELGIPCGGWCPKGRLAEDGVIHLKYPLQETDSPEYSVRTEMNVTDSDATLILTKGPVTEGTAMTLELAKKHKKPHLVVGLSTRKDPMIVKKWLAFNQVGVLNVAGPRESNAPGIYAAAIEFLRRVLQQKE